MPRLCCIITAQLSCLVAEANVDAAVGLSCHGAAVLFSHGDVYVYVYVYAYEYEYVCVDPYAVYLHVYMYMHMYINVVHM